jgi:hypothetical protein
MTPAWILDIFAALMLVVAAVSAARLAVARLWQGEAVGAGADVSHLLMGIAMAGMLASGLTTLPNAAWEVIFGVLTAWFGYRLVRDARANGVRALAGGHCVPHLAHSAAMLYMFLALAASAAGGGSEMGGMSGSSGSATQALKYPTLTFALALILVGYTVWDLDQLSGRRYSLSSPVAVPAVVPAMAGAEPAPVAFSATAVAAGPAAGDGGVSGGLAARRLLLSAGATVSCRIAMGVTMAFMLLVML